MEVHLLLCNDDSDEEHRKLLEEELYHFYRRKRFIKIVYKKTKDNKGISKTHHNGVLTCG